MLGQRAEVDPWSGCLFCRCSRCFRAASEAPEDVRVAVVRTVGLVSAAKNQVAALGDVHILNPGVLASVSSPPRNDGLGAVTSVLVARGRVNDVPALTFQLQGFLPNDRQGGRPCVQSASGGNPR